MNVPKMFKHYQYPSKVAIKMLMKIMVRQGSKWHKPARLVEALLPSRTSGKKNNLQAALVTKGYGRRPTKILKMQDETYYLKMFVSYSYIWWLANIRVYIHTYTRIVYAYVH